MALTVLELNEKLKAKRAEMVEAEKVSFETREADIAARIESATDEERDAVESEIDNLNADKAAHENAVADLRNAIEELEKEIAEIEAAEPVNINIERKNENMENMITRDSVQYVNAYADYIRTGNDREVRSILTENVEGGTVAVPSIVESTIKTAWEKSDLMSLVKKTYIKGNVKVGFEISGDGAVAHIEGTAAPTEENLVLGIASLIPASVKKWITISDESADMGGEEFLRYVYSEVTYRIAKACEASLLFDIATSRASATHPAVPHIEAGVALGTVATAISNLSDEASNPVIVMNKLTYSAFKAAQYEANFAADPFEGLKVLFNNNIPAYGTAEGGDVYMIVGDFSYGAQANYPNGTDIRVKVDENSLAERDLIKYVGRCYVGLGVVAPNAFVAVEKPGEESVEA